jgi:hypothetical protein
MNQVLPDVQWPDLSLGNPGPTVIRMPLRNGYTKRAGRRLRSDNDDTRAAEEEARQSADKINAVLDRVRAAVNPGTRVEEAEVLLKEEWLAEFGTDIPLERLVAFAPALAHGHTFRVLPDGTLGGPVTVRAAPAYPLRGAGRLQRHNHLSASAPGPSAQRPR